MDSCERIVTAPSTDLPLDQGESWWCGGGVATGLQIAFKMGADWVWMMNDDVEPEPNALSELLNIATEPTNIYGSLAIDGTETAWNTTLLLD